MATSVLGFQKGHRKQDPETEFSAAVMKGEAKFHVFSFLAVLFSWVFSLGFADNSTSIALQPLNPANGNLVPAIPVQSEVEVCPLDLTEELFAAIKGACGGKGLNRVKCCPVLAAWFYAAYARTAFRSLRLPASENEPVLPDDSRKCVDSLQISLHGRGIRLPQPNETCDPVLCYCGIRLHQISPLTCPQAFNVTARYHRRGNGTVTSSHVTASPAVRELEESCRTPTYAGCATCRTALQQLDGMAEVDDSSDRTSRIYSRDCQLMAMTWLLAKNRTAYVRTVSAVFRALMYSGLPPHTTTCVSNRQKMPLPVDSSQLDEASAANFGSAKLLPIVFIFVTHMIVRFSI